jgi:hypothetical protein
VVVKVESITLLVLLAVVAAVVVETQLLLVVRELLDKDMLVDKDMTQVQKLAAAVVALVVLAKTVAQVVAVMAALEIICQHGQVQLALVMVGITHLVAVVAQAQ